MPFQHNSIETTTISFRKDHQIIGAASDDSQSENERTISIMNNTSSRQIQASQEECALLLPHSTVTKKVPAPKELLSKNLRSKVGIDIVLAVLGAIERADGGWEGAMESGKRGKFLEGVNETLHHETGQLN